MTGRQAIRRIRQWRRYRRILSALEDEYLGTGWRFPPGVRERLRSQARSLAGLS